MPWEANTCSRVRDASSVVTGTNAFGASCRIVGDAGGVSFANKSFASSFGSCRPRVLNRVQHKLKFVSPAKPLVNC